MEPAGERLVVNSCEEESDSLVTTPCKFQFMFIFLIRKLKYRFSNDIKFLSFPSAVRLVCVSTISMLFVEIRPEYAPNHIIGSIFF